MKDPETRSYDISDAKKHGLIEAVLLYNFRFWISKNKANGKHYHNGNTWTYNSNKAFSIMYPEFSPAQIRRALENLIEKGILLTGNYNKAAFDRTKWYALNEQMHLSQETNGIVVDDETIPDTLPDIKPDNNSNNKTEPKNEKPQPKTFAEIKTERGIMTDKEALDEAVKDQMFIERLCMQVGAQKNISHELMQCYFVAVYSFWIYDLKTTHDNRKDFRNHLINTIKKDIAGNQTLYKDAITIFNQRKNKQK